MKGIIKAVAKEGKTYNEITTLGFLIGEVWYNLKGDEKIFTAAKAMFLSKGNEIEFKLVGGYAVEFNLLKKAPEEKKDENMMNLDMLLESAHKDGKLQNIRTEIISIDHEKKIAVFKAVVTMKSNDETTLGQEFEAHGDANYSNLGDKIKEHYIRMAETRSIVRALRWATNNAECSEEEK